MQHNTSLKLASEKSLLNVFFPLTLKCNALWSFPLELLIILKSNSTGMLKSAMFPKLTITLSTPYRYASTYMISKARDGGSSIILEHGRLRQEDHKRGGTWGGLKGGNRTG